MAHDWVNARRLLEAALTEPSTRRRAGFLLWEVCQALRDPKAAVAHLQAAIRESPLTSRPSACPKRRVLAIATVGDFQANLPLAYLFDGDTTELHTLWLDEQMPLMRDPDLIRRMPLPAFDCAFVTVAEDPRHTASLAVADAIAAALGKPVINMGQQIRRMSRAGAAELLQDIPGTIVPQQTLWSRANLERTLTAQSGGQALPFPLIIRPQDSHAGRDLGVLDRSMDLADYLGTVAAEYFFLAPFIDYRNADGLYRKYRIIFVEGEPWPYHMAISDQWAVWYYNAGMELDARKRAEEARFLENIAQVFAPAAMTALRAIAHRVGLDYFGLDCGLLDDGRVVVFEVETGMIVHNQDPVDLYPYKKTFVPRITQAVEAMIDCKIANHGGLPSLEL